MDAKDRCTRCKGDKTVEEAKVINVTIPKGIREGEKIRFAQEGDQSPGVTPGDIVVVVKVCKIITHRIVTSF